MHALLLLLPLALAADPSLADLDAAAARARALTISGPAPGQRLTQQQESALLRAQLRDRARAVQEAEVIAGALILSGDPQLQAAALLRLGWVKVELGDASMAPDLQVFVSLTAELVHEALPTACGVSDHLQAGVPPEAAPHDPSPAVAPIPDLAGLQAALDLAVAQPQGAPQPDCLRGPTSEAALLRLGALRSVERAAQGLAGSAAHRALADAFTQASRDLGAHLPAAGLVVPSAEVARQAAGARWAAARADQHLWAIATDALATEAERRQAQDDLVALTRWRLMLEATRPPEPIDARRVER